MTTGLALHRRRAAFKLAAAAGNTTPQELRRQAFQIECEIFVHEHEHGRTRMAFRRCKICMLLHPVSQTECRDGLYAFQISLMLGSVDAWIEV